MSKGNDPEDHGFDDDYVRIEEDLIRDRNGVVDLKSCILRRVVRTEREWMREDNEFEQRNMHSYDSSWLFLGRGDDLRALGHLTCNERFEVNDYRRNTQWQQWHANALLPGVDVFIRCGAWLFSSSTPAGSFEHLIRLTDHSIRHKRIHADVTFGYCRSIYSEYVHHHRSGYLLGYCRRCRVRREGECHEKREEEMNRENMLQLFSNDD